MQGPNWDNICNILGTISVIYFERNYKKETVNFYMTKMLLLNIIVFIGKSFEKMSFIEKLI